LDLFQSGEQVYGPARLVALRRDREPTTYNVVARAVAPPSTLHAFTMPPNSHLQLKRRLEHVDNPLMQN